MPKTRIRKRVRHAPDEMLQFVTDVEKYPEFINFVSTVHVLKREKISADIERFSADVAAQYKFIRETFRSHVTINRAEKTLEIKRDGHGGAVRTLRNDWKFIELADGSTLIDFSIDVKLKVAVLDFLIRQKFQKATTHMIDVFERRAAQVCKVVGDEGFDLPRKLGV